MERTLDIFENLPDGTPIWRDAISGLHCAIKRMEELASASTNHFTVMDVHAKKVLASSAAIAGS
jgi:hypothetical protein